MHYKIDFNLNKTLEQLENNYWPEPKYDSHLVKTCHALRRKPLREFETEDLRIMIGQNFSLNYLIPLAIEKLSNNILAEGNMYEGDLLHNILSVDQDYWIKNKKEWAIIYELFNNNKRKLEHIDSIEVIINLFKRFENIWHVDTK